MRSRSGPVLVLSLALVSLSCATSTSFQIASQLHPQAPALSPVDPDAVRVLKERPPEYVVVGEIRAELQGYKWREDVIHDPALAASVRAEAARMGANAVMEIDVIEHQMGGGGPFFGPPGAPPRGSGRLPTTLVATAIRTSP